MNDCTPVFRDAQCAFADAIRTGALSDNPGSPVYAALFMYMNSGRDGREDAFKNVETRKYLYAMRPREGGGE